MLETRGGRCLVSRRQVIEIRHFIFLLEAAPNFAAIVFFFCWNQPIRFCYHVCLFVEISVSIFCFHHLRFLLEPVQIFATMFQQDFCWIGEMFRRDRRQERHVFESICWHRLFGLLQPTSFFAGLVRCFVVTVDDDGMFFCWNRQCFFAGTMFIFATT